MGNLVKLGMAWGILLAATCFAGAEDPPLQTDYLLLKSGAVLTGRVVKEENTYILKSLTSSGESRYPASMVARVCNSPLEVLALLKKNIVPEEASDHCRLAKFCLQHSLMQEAKAEIEEALRCDRRSAEALTLIRQWQAKTAKPTTSTDEVPPLPGASVKPIPPATLDEWPVALTPVAFQDFSRRVQPMMLAGCGVGACHGNAEGKRGFAMKRGLVGVQPSTEMSRSNLERVLSLVDRSNPETSELLRKAQQPHGNVRHWSVTAEQQAAFKQWVGYIAGKNQEIAKQEHDVLQGTTSPGKSSNDFASGTTGNTNDKVEQTGKLPVIPGMSGAAVQQTGSEVPASSGKAPDAPPTKEPPVKQSGGLPPIPGVSGKGQGPMGQTPPPQPGKTSAIPGERKALALQEQPAYRDYARRLGMINALAAPKDGTPDRMHIVNAGTYSVFVPPPPTLPEEVQNQLKRQEEAKTKKPNDTSTTATGFLNTGTIVNAPGK